MTNDKGKGLPSSKIIIPVLTIIAETDSFGNYTIANLPVNRYRVWYKNADYSVDSRFKTFEQPDSIHIIFVPSPYFNKEFNSGLLIILINC